jgi:hypothetical protein
VAQGRKGGKPHRVHFGFRLSWGMVKITLLSVKVLGGTGILPVGRTGWKPVPPKAAGEDARPT